MTPPRLAHADRAEAAEAFLESFRAGFEGQVDEPTLAALCRVGRDRFELRLRDPQTEVRAASRDGQIVGLVATNPSADVDTAGAGELSLCYVRPAWWGMGVADDLLTAAAADLATAGFATAVLWVLDEHERAKAAYRRHGWVDDPVVRDVAIGAARFPHRRMRLTI